MLKIKEREVDIESARKIEEMGASPLVSKLMAARGVTPEVFANQSLKNLLNPLLMKGVREAASIIREHLLNGKKILILGDYDCDGATATATGIKGLKMLAESAGISSEKIEEAVRFIVPNRFDFGYGMSPAIVDVAYELEKPDLIVTVDNGISSIEGALRAKELGIKVIVTDHHLPADQTPEVEVIVNPNQRGCEFPSKSLPGVGVMFYTLLVLRKLMQEKGDFPAEKRPKIENLLDLVALGIVADVVPLCPNNRIMVANGLKRIKTGLACAGIKAIFASAGKKTSNATTSDFGFAVGPRLNAAGRLADMTLGIKCLISDDFQTAFEYAQELSAMNTERKKIETEMKVEADSQMELADLLNNIPHGIVLNNENGHHGVVGILASRVKEKYYRPTIIFAPEEDKNILRGSGRSIPGVHLRDVIDLMTKRLPKEAIIKFGGHAMAAGLSIRKKYFDEFKKEFSQAIADLSGVEVFNEVLETDGAIDEDQINVDNARAIANQVWGQGFPSPVFSESFTIVDQRKLRGGHSRFVLRKGRSMFNAVWWKKEDDVQGEIKVSFRLEEDFFRGNGEIQLVIDRELT